MTLQELLKDPIVKLPKRQSTIPAVSFRKFLFEILDEFQKKVDTLDLSVISAALPNVEKIRVKNLIDGIKNSVESHLNGKPSEAYQYLHQAFTGTQLLSDLRTRPFSKTPFYRLRKEETNYAMGRGELFHIPFHKRGEVTTMRYSIPGFPCLYFSDSIYVAWEEMRRPSLDKIQVVRLENIDEIKVVDLTTDIYLGDDSVINSKNADEQWNHVFLWPLIAACSVKVLNDDAKFKPEYIIPQLLLQIVRNNDALHGIMFSSTHIDRNKVDLKGSFLNFAIPVKESSDEGHCKTLLSIFNSTTPVPWEISEVFSETESSVIHGGGSPLASVTLNVKSIQLIDGKDIPYAASTFGRLEKFLLNMTPESIV